MADAPEDDDALSNLQRLYVPIREEINFKDPRTFFAWARRAQDEYTRATGVAEYTQNVLTLDTVAALLRPRRCMMCHVEFQDINNFTLDCPLRTQVVPYDVAKGAHPCCGRRLITGPSYLSPPQHGCVVASHIDNSLSAWGFHTDSYVQLPLWMLSYIKYSGSSVKRYNEHYVLLGRYDWKQKRERVRKARRI